MSSALSETFARPGWSRLVRSDRVAGAGGLVFFLLLVVDNAVRAKAPAFGASSSTVAAYLQDHRFAMILPIALFPLGMIGLFSFVSGLWTRAGIESRGWMHAGVLGTAAITGLFSVVNLIEGGLVAATRASDLEGSVVTALWSLSGAGFGLNMAAIGLTAFCLSQAARAQALIPAWLAQLVVVGAFCLLVASIFAIAIAEGQAWLFLGVAGFVIWGVFVVVTSVRLLRGAHEPRS